MTPQKQWIAFCGIVRKELTRIMRIWPQTLVPSAITTALYFLVFGHLIGSRIGLMSGLPYMVFIMPGLVMLPLITNTYANVVTSFFGARYGHSIEEILVSPTPDWVIVFGYAVGGIVRGVLIALIVTGVAWYFTGVPIAHPAMALIVVVLCSFFFAFAGFLNGMFARNFDDTSIVTTFILTPLIYVGGVFYNIATLPPFWQSVARFNPIYHVVSLFRYAMLDIGEISVRGDLWFIVFGSLALLLTILFCMRRGYGLKT